MLVRPRFDLYLPFPLPRHACKNCLMWTQRLIKKFQVIQNSTPLSPLIQLTETVYQICTQCKWRHLVVKCKWCHLTMAMKMECEQGRISWDGPYIKLPLPNSPYHCIIFGVRTIMLHTLRVEAGLGGLSVLWAWVTWKDVDSRLWSARWGGGAGPGSCTTSDVREILRPGRVRIRCWSDSAHYLSSNYTLSSLQDTYRPERCTAKHATLFSTAAALPPLLANLSLLMLNKRPKRTQHPAQLPSGKTKVSQYQNRNV